MGRARVDGDRATVHVTETRSILRRGGQYGIGPTETHRLETTGDWTIRPSGRPERGESTRSTFSAEAVALRGDGHGTLLERIASDPVTSDDGAITTKIAAAALAAIASCDGLRRAASRGESTAGPSEAIVRDSTGTPRCAWSDLYSRCLPPVDPSIAPISLSQPTPGAAAALARCLVGRDDVEVVVGGRIARARDAWQYVPIPPNQGGLDSNEPTWLLQLRGEFTFPTGSPAPADGGIWLNPLCFVSRATGYMASRGANPSRITKRPATCAVMP
jgi:hypothetical protein